MRRIVLHDYFESLEGGGRLCSLLAQGFATEIGYGFAKRAHPFLKNLSNTHDLGAYSSIPLWRQFKLSWFFTHHTHFLRHYDTVIYSGFYTPLAIHHHLHGRNIFYCHTPPRFVYDQRDFYLNLLPKGLHPALKLFIRYLQPRYEEAIAKMDIIVANSENVRHRIKTYLGQEAIVVYPPCDVNRFVWHGQKDYYLSTGRLDPLKRVELIIQAFLAMPDKQLIVTSGGGEYDSLRKLAHQASNIHFTGWVDEEQLSSLLGHAIATLYLPKDEDFGMSPIESMAAGKPVIGVAEGGLLETIIPEETGILLHPPLTVEKICQAVEIMTPQRAMRMRDSCEKRGQYFQTETFLKNMHTIML